ncbi:MAG: hypothetical protein ACJ762_20840 [Solirubrobacteraceae bacterium]
MRVSPVVCLTLLIAALSASSAQAGFNCSASAGRITVLGQKVEPVTANAGATECAGADATLTGPAAGLPAPFTASAVVASTTFVPAQKSIVAQGGIADIKVAALPTLPIALPPVTVPDALKTVSVDISALKTLLNPLNIIPAVSALPSTVTLDASAAVNALLPDGKLPTVDLLRVKGAMAYAAGSCQGGAASVAGSSSVAGINVWGTDLPVGELIDKTLTLIDTASIDPSQANLAAINLGVLGQAPISTLINTVPGGQAALVAALQSALDALPNLKVLDPTVAQVKVVPGLRAQDATHVTQQALNITVTIAGQTLVDAVIGEAKASSENVDCADPIADPATPSGATLQCSTRKLVLVDVLERNHRVKLNGVADPSLAGKTVSIVFNATGKVVAYAKVGRTGAFRTSAALPPRNLRDTNDARYMATLGKEESINLKLRRRMIVKSMTSKNGKVTISGRVLPPLGKPLQAITLSRRVSCKDEKVVTRFKPRRNGTFRITVKAPKGLGTAVYRMTTRVRNSAHGSGMFETYTLPRAVDLTS